jgi:hypothetical protein
MYVYICIKHAYIYIFLHMYGCTSINDVRFEVFTAVIMKNGVFWVSRRVTFVRADVSEERSASIIKVTRIGELGTLAVNESVI